MALHGRLRRPGASLSPAGGLLAVAGAAALATLAAGSVAVAGLVEDVAPAAEADATARHPFRLSVADAKVEGDMLRMRIRFFWDDLQLAVMEHTSDMAFRLEKTPRVDSIVLGYIDQMLAIEVGGKPLIGTLAGRGVDEATLIDEVMWWYSLDYRLPAGTERIAIRNRLLFNMFEDQRNVVHLKTRDGSERAYAFGWNKDRAAAALN